MASKRNQMCAAAVAAVCLLGIAPACWTVYRDGGALLSYWRAELLLSPAFWIWAVASWLAISTSAATVLRLLMFYSVDDFAPAQLARTLAALAGLGVALTLVWLLIARAAMPDLSPHQ